MKHFFFRSFVSKSKSVEKTFCKSGLTLPLCVSMALLLLRLLHGARTYAIAHAMGEREAIYLVVGELTRARVRSHRPFFIFFFRISFSFAGWCGANDVHTMYTRIRHNDEAWIHAPMATTDSQSTANYVQEKLCSVLISASLMDLRCEIFCHFIYLFRCFFIRAQNQPVRRFLPGDFKQRRHHSIVMYIHFHK